MFLGLLAAPDLFADDRVLLSYLAITDDIGRYFFFLFFFFFPLFFSPREKIYSYEYRWTCLFVSFFASMVIRTLFSFPFF